MYVDSCTYTVNGNQYTRHLLRESFRENGKVRHRTLANLSHCSPAELQAIKLALRHKHNLQELGDVNQDISVQQGVSCGAVLVLWQVARRLGLVDALGSGQEGKRALWQVFARVLEQGSRLSAVRLANAHAACDVLELEDFNEDDLYDNLDWLAEHQDEIEDRLFRLRYDRQTPELYLYDVTSSYLEGVCNALAAFGYCRDGKTGKMQVVYGLLCDGGGAVTFVGDRGMIKGPQIEQLQAEKEHQFHYITAITKAQIGTLLKRGVIQMSLFDETLAEVLEGSVRYVLRRNPQRAEEIARGRRSKLASLQKLVQAKNDYLASHPRAGVATAQRAIEAKQKKLRLPEIVLTVAERTFSVAPQADAWAEAAKLDGCYCLKTDVLSEHASKETIHDRYKDLASVEWAFRTSKTGLLEARPVYVRLETRTRGHLLVVMLAYLLVQELARCWHDEEVTVEEGLDELKSLCTTCVTVKGQSVLHNVPRPRETVQRLLDAAQVTLPKKIADRGVRVSTRKKLVEERQTLC